MFVNFSNHKSSLWTQKQKEAAYAYGEIVDIPFPAVPAEDSVDDIIMIANEYTDIILQMKPRAVMCQGEFTLAFTVVSKLRSHGITVFAACSERRVTELSENNTIQKSSIFEFRQFREYSV